MATKKSDPSLGERLRSLRESEGWSLREVATKAGVNHGYLSQLERGDVSQPAPGMLHKLADGYGESFVTLMRWAGYVDAAGPEVSANQARALSYLGDDVSDQELEAIKAVLQAIRAKRATMTSFASLDGPLPDQDRAVIRATMLRLLRRADAEGIFPTPLAQVMEVSRLVAAGEVSLDHEERRLLRKRFGSLVDRVLDRLQGVIHFQSREIWVRPDLHALRKRFVTAHEIGHHTLPWQRDVIAYLDDNERLSPAIRLGYEREANQAAIELLAQGDALRKEADDSKLTVELLSRLSARFQISLQATARRVVEETRQPAALSVRFRGVSGRLGPNHLYCSTTFDSRFGWGVGGLPAPARAAGGEAMGMLGVADFKWVDLANRPTEVHAETIDTPRAVLTLYTPTANPRGVRRLLRVG